MESLLDSTVFAWIVLPILIFCSRIMDVTLGTIRIIFVSRGKRALAPVLGFFEVMIWLIVITSVMKYASNFVCYLAYGLGFATGNYVGIRIEEKLAIGILAVRVFAPDGKAGEIGDLLSEKGFGVTQIKASGKINDTNILHCIIRRKELDEFVRIVHSIDENLFYYVEELKHVNNGIFLDKLELTK